MAAIKAFVALLFAFAILRAASTVLVEDQLLSEPQAQHDSLEGMLSWAIRHSDAQKLFNIARETEALPSREQAQRREDMKEFLSKVKIPADTDFMKISIRDLQNSSTSVDERKHALDELIELVEPIDNANNLDKLGGLRALLDELSSSEAKLRTAAAWALGKACQNNPTVQNQAYQHNKESAFLPKLMAMSLDGTSSQESLKGFYALSALIRNNIPWQDEFFVSNSGEKWLRNLVAATGDGKLLLKCVNLIEDLASEPDSRIPQDLSRSARRLGTILSSRW